MTNHINHTSCLSNPSATTEGITYSRSYLKELEHQSAIRLAQKRGYEKGWKEGYEKGWKEGYEKGWKEGYEEGRRLVIARFEELSPEFNISDDMKKKIIAGLKEDF